MKPALLTRQDIIALLERLRSDMTLQQLAEHFGYKSPSTMADILSGRRPPTEPVLTKLRIRRVMLERYEKIK